MADAGPSRSRNPSAPRVILANTPYVAMAVLGAGVFVVSLEQTTWAWIGGGAYLGYAAAGAFWIMLFMCPWCRFHGDAGCPCGYGRVSALLRARKPHAEFAKRFRRHIPVIVPLWFIPLAPGGLALYGEFSWPVAGLIAAFALAAFVILPQLSKKSSCGDCPQKDDCPWMGRKGTC